MSICGIDFEGEGVIVTYKVISKHNVISIGNIYFDTIEEANEFLKTHEGVDVEYEK